MKLVYYVLLKNRSILVRKMGKIWEELGKGKLGLEYTVWKNLFSIKKEHSLKRLSNELTIVGSILGREMVVS